MEFMDNLLPSVQPVATFWSHSHGNLHSAASFSKQKGKMERWMDGVNYLGTTDEAVPSWVVKLGPEVSAV